MVFSLFLISAFYRHSPKCSYVFQSIQSLKRFLKVDTDVIMSILQMEKVSHSQTNCSHIAHPASGRAGSQVKGICVHNYSTSLLSAKRRHHHPQGFWTQNIPELESGGVQNSAAMINVLFDQARCPPVTQFPALGSVFLEKHIL